MDVISFREDLTLYLERLMTRRRILNRAEAFVQSCYCNGQQCNGFAIFSEAVKVVCDGIELSADETFTTLRYDQFMSVAISSLKAQLARYFPADQLDTWKIFLPKNLPKDISEIANYGHITITNLTARFRMGQPDQFLSEWKIFLEAIIKSDTSCITRRATPHIFWTTQLNRADLQQYTNIVRLIRAVLVIPSGTVDVERSFSFLNHIKSPRKSLLNVKHLEDRMRLSINGDENIDLIPFS